MSTRAEAAAAPADGGAAGRAGRDVAPLAWLGLLAGAALISGFTILRGGAEFDEGVVLTAAARVAAGELPYRDFLWPYGPAQPYVLGGWFELFGPSLLSWRVLRVACDAALAVTAFAIVRREAPLPLALVAWLVTACVMAQPTSATPFPFALLAVLLGFYVATSDGSGAGRLVFGGVLMALAAAWRLDVALSGERHVGGELGRGGIAVLERRVHRRLPELTADEVWERLDVRDRAHGLSVARASASVWSPPPFAGPRSSCRRAPTRAGSRSACGARRRPRPSS